jgi:hypothetical protein
MSDDKARPKITATPFEWRDPAALPRRRRPCGPVFFIAKEVPHRGEALHKIYWQGRQWAVTAYGIERRDGTYAIEAQRLSESIDSKITWLWHMAQKDDVDLEDFRTAFLVACSIFKISVSIECFLEGRWNT